MAALAGGLALGASFVDFRLYVLPWIALAPLLAIAERVRPARAFALGTLAGAAGIGIAFAWLVYAMRVFGGFATPVALLLYLPVVASMGVQLGLFLALLAWTGPLRLGLAAPITFVAVEFLFPKLFPWRLANSQYRVVPLLQSGEVAGPFLLSFAIVWMNAAVLALVRLMRARAGGRPTPVTRDTLGTIAAPLLLVAILFAAGVWRVERVRAARARAPSLRVGMVQGNVSVEHKGNRAFFGRNLDAYREASRAIADRVDLLIWPETVFQQDIATTRTRLAGEDDPFPAAPRPLLFGGLAVEQTPGAPPRVHNSAFLRGLEGEVVGRYDKRILVPFGEYMPLGDRFPVLRTLSPGTSNFAAGGEPVLLAAGPLARLGPLICYEDVIPEPARSAVRRGATLLVNLTNDAWYGEGAEPVQHQALAVWRAVETRRDLLRATNTGLTSAIAATGEVLGELPTFVADTLVTEVHPLRSTTPYTALGDVFGWSVVLAALGIAAARRGRGRRLRSPERVPHPRRKRRRSRAYR